MAVQITNAGSGTLERVFKQVIPATTIMDDLTEIFNRVLEPLYGPQRDALQKIALGKDRVCYLHVPVNKTGPAFSKPVAPYVGTMIGAWEQVRPPQQRQLDRKSAEWVAYLFSVRGKRLGRHYLNNVLIPLVCRKAGIPENDPRSDYQPSSACHHRDIPEQL